MKSKFVRIGLLGPLLLATVASAQFSPGARTAGDPYLPTLGNGGYDVEHYNLTINYDPLANTIAAQAAITMRAVQDLSEFSFDLRGFAGATVTIDGAAAGALKEADKLVITPASGITNGHVFQTVVTYAGKPASILDPDGFREGWVRIPTGGFVVNEPVGAMGWFPSNNHPADKATYEFHITVPSTHTALGNGELVGRSENGDGTTTWHWRLDFPMSTYLSTSTIGRFDYTNSVSARIQGASGKPLELNNAFESALPAVQKSAASVAAARQEDIIDFISNEIGAPYPFDSHGVVLYRISLGYAIEVQTKTHFSDAPIDLVVLAHEIAHQWFGDSVGPATWREVWFNEGWATWWEWYWDNKRNGAPATVEQVFTGLFNSAQPESWNTPPANLPGASQLFSPFSIYYRPAMMLEAYRQIVGPSAFFALQHALVTEYAYSSITTGQFIALAKRIAQVRLGFPISYLAQLDEFFRQWLYNKSKPTLTPATFFQELTPRLLVRSTNPAEFELVWRQTTAQFALEQAEELNNASWTPVPVSPVLTNGEIKVIVTRAPGNRFYRLRSE